MKQNIIQFFNHHTMLSILWISLFISVLSIILKRFISKIIMITCEEAIRLINKENAVVIDIRQQKDFCKGHIIGSINMISVEIKTNIRNLNKYKSNTIIIVNDTEIKTQNIASFLNKNGFEKVFILKGGISGWKLENLPLIINKSEIYN